MLDPDRLVRDVLAAGGTAAFDADGTLWADDIGESFLRALEAEGLVPAGAFRTYVAICARDPAAAYLQAVTAMAGLEEARVRARAEAFFDAHFDRRIFPQVRALLLALLAAGARVAIVSASNRWLIEAAGRRLGVARVAGVAVEVQGGRLTDRPLLPLPVDDGKVHWARALLGGAPSLAVGNGAIDRALLHSARHRLVICPSDDPETPLAEEARARGWPVLELAHPCSGEALP